MSGADLDPAERARRESESAALYEMRLARLISSVGSLRLDVSQVERRLEKVEGTLATLAYEVGRLIGTVERVGPAVADVTGAEGTSLLAAAVIGAADRDRRTRP